LIELSEWLYSSGDRFTSGFGGTTRILGVIRISNGNRTRMGQISDHKVFRSQYLSKTASHLKIQPQIEGECRHGSYHKALFVLDNK